MKLDLLIKNANEIITVKGASHIPKTGKAFQEISIVKGNIGIKYGRILNVDNYNYKAKQVIDATGKVVMPGFIDCHTHLVHAGSRHYEYEGKCSGKSYSDIDKKGGILYTVEQTRKASIEDLVEKGLKDLDIMLSHGTTTVEIKTGYGLDQENEIKMLYAINELQKKHPMTIIPTYLGAHKVPPEYENNRQGYIKLVKDLILTIKKENLAEYCDVFCDKIGFTYKESKEILEEAKRHGMKLKVHAEQTNYNRGAELAAKLGAVSADHLDYISKKGIEDMKASGTIGVLLPGVTYHLTEMIPGHKKVKKFLPKKIRRMIENELPIALSTDYNPGSCRTQSMQAIMEIAARLYRMNYAEIINASTINAAHAIGRSNEIGSIEFGKKADLVIYDCEEHGILIDKFGINLAKIVIKNGKIINLY
ncbi:MAG: imidazolonepropionase [Nanoarchaeota archaeon]|nr:imidazolonepropionase [Nanoarchaeota archaeon]MCG2718123.1 imidazolonepropionase [Nanoarchaeota archaeon]